MIEDVNKLKGEIVTLNNKIVNLKTWEIALNKEVVDLKY